MVAYVRPAQDQSGQHASMEWTGICKLTPLRCYRLLVALEKGTVSLREWSLVGQPSPGDGLAPMNIWAEQIGFGGLFGEE